MGKGEGAGLERAVCAAPACNWLRRAPGAAMRCRACLGDAPLVQRRRRVERQLSQPTARRQGSPKAGSAPSTCANVHNQRFTAQVTLHRVPSAPVRHRCAVGAECRHGLILAAAGVLVGEQSWIRGCPRCQGGREQRREQRLRPHVGGSLIKQQCVYFVSVFRPHDPGRVPTTASVGVTRRGRALLGLVACRFDGGGGMLSLSLIRNAYALAVPRTTQSTRAAVRVARATAAAPPRDPAPLCALTCHCSCLLQTARKTHSSRESLPLSGRGEGCGDSQGRQQWARAHPPSMNMHQPATRSSHYLARRQGLSHTMTGDSKAGGPAPRAHGGAEGRSTPAMQAVCGAPCAQIAPPWGQRPKTSPWRGKQRARMRAQRCRNVGKLQWDRGPQGWCGGLSPASTWTAGGGGCCHAPLRQQSRSVQR